MNIDMTEFGIGSILTIAATAGVLLLSVAAVVLFVWVLLVIALPLLGSLGWLFLGRPDARRQLAAVGQG